MCRRRRLDGLIVLAERIHHRVRRFLPQARAALDIGEEEGDHTIGKGLHRSDTISEALRLVENL